MVSENRLFRVKYATWPAAQIVERGCWLLRRGDGGGKRVSAATPVRVGADIVAAEAGMLSLGQTPLFSLRDSDRWLDVQLTARGYRLVDPSVFLCAPVADLCAERLPFLAASFGDSPLALQCEIWRQGGIGPGRLNVMARANCPKTFVLGRAGDKPLGTAFVGLSDGVAMVHAVEILPEARRQGVAAAMMGAIAGWAQDQGAAHIACITTEANVAALALYTKLGMANAARYHYRIRDDG